MLGRDFAQSLAIPAGGAGTFAALELVPPAEWAIELSHFVVVGTTIRVIYTSTSIIDVDPAPVAIQGLNPATTDLGIGLQGARATAALALGLNPLNNIPWVLTQPIHCDPYARQRIAFHNTTENSGFTVHLVGRLVVATDRSKDPIFPLR